MKILATLVLLFIAAVPALAQSRADTPAPSGCATGEPWFLPAAPANRETAMLVVVNAKDPVQVRLCNCPAKEDGQTYVWVNPNTTTEDPPPAKKAAVAKSKVKTMGSATQASQLYVGSCLEAMGNNITIRNTLPKDQRGTYVVRGVK